MSIWHLRPTSFLEEKLFFVCFFTKARAGQNPGVRVGFREHFWEQKVTHGYSFHISSNLWAIWPHGSGSAVLLRLWHWIWLCQTMNQDLGGFKNRRQLHVELSVQRMTVGRGVWLHGKQNLSEPVRWSVTVNHQFRVSQLEPPSDNSHCPCVYWRDSSS